MRAAFAVLAALAVLAACGDDGASSDERALLATLGTTCDTAHRCRDSYAGAAPFTSVYGNSRADCGTMSELVARIGGIAIDEGRTAWDGAAAAQCRAHVEASSCEDFWGGAPAPSCDSMLTGLAPTGTACSFGWECASDRCREAACADAE